MALIVASLAIPALTKQWSDRQQELELKRVLTADLAAGTFGAYVRLACCLEETDTREAMAETLRRYPGANRSRPGRPPPSEVWLTLGCGHGCVGFEAAYNWLGLELVDTRPNAEIVDARVEGFSRGPADFVRDMVGPLGF